MPVPGRRMGRLAGLKGPPPTRKRPEPPPKPAQMECPTCKESGEEQDIQQTDSGLICNKCFTQLSEENIVAEVTFEEQAGGRAAVQGGTVHENSRHAKTLGLGSRRLGGGERNSLQDIQQAGRRALGALYPRLGIEEHVQVQAETIWSLAASFNFSAGRKTDEVVAACLYAACRRQKDNRILLMDIAELLQINVFRLGEVYKDMCKTLYMKNENVGHQYLQELEPLIKKYCDKLQFADKTKVVAEDALKIIRRMNRDWIVAGRHPAGLCGACIILAARMNNFQRSVREVVYVSKVADVTIAKRVEEFRRTKSSGLTVDLFREYANRIRHQHDPPSSFAQDEKARLMRNRKRKRDEHIRLQTIERESQARGSQQPSVISIPDDGSEASSRLSSVDSNFDVPMYDEILDRLAREKRQKTGESDMSPTPPEESPTASPAPESSTQPTGLQPTPPTTQQSLPSATQEATKRKRDDNEDTPSDASSKRQRNNDSPPGDNQPTQQEGRVDSDGFAIPALPASAIPVVPVVPAMIGSGGPVQVQTDAQSRASSATPAPADASRASTQEPDVFAPKKRGRKKKEKEPPPKIDLSQEELDVENYLELEIEKFLEHSEVQESQSEVEKAKEEDRINKELERAKVVAAERQKLDAEKNKERREALGQPAYDSDDEDLEKLFENDPEVAYCILKPHEVKIKEQIWVAHNEDWLRKMAEKEMMDKLARQNGTAPTRGRKRKEGGKVRKKRSKMGDGTVLTEASTPVETPADAARLMIEKRAPSKNVDYSVLNRIYKHTTPSSNASSPNRSGSQSRQATPAGGSPAPSSSAMGGATDDGASQQADSPPAADDDVEDDEEEQQDPSQWDDINVDAPQDDDDEGDAAYNRVVRRQGPLEEDEFGVVDNGFGDYGSGDEYE